MLSTDQLNKLISWWQPLPLDLNEDLSFSAREDWGGWYHKMYQVSKPKVIYFVEKNGGTRADGEDLFQEASLIVWQKRMAGTIREKATDATIIYAVARNLWYQHLRKHGHLQSLEPSELNILENSTTAETNQEEQINGLLSRLTIRCQRLLHLVYIVEISADKAMNLLGYKNQHSMASQKYKCMEAARSTASHSQI